MDPRFLSEGWCHLQKSMEKSRLEEGKVRREEDLNFLHVYSVFWSFLLLMSEFFRAGPKSFEYEIR